jgi:hypothetical protein
MVQIFIVPLSQGMRVERAVKDTRSGPAKNAGSYPARKEHNTNPHAARSAIRPATWSDPREKRDNRHGRLVPVLLTGMKDEESLEAL